jgi:hypothetical protein
MNTQYISRSSYISPERELSLVPEFSDFLITLPAKEELEKIYSDNNFYEYITLLHRKISSFKGKNKESIVSLYNTMIDGLMSLNQPVDQDKLKQIIVDFLSQEKVTQFMTTCTDDVVKQLVEHENKILKNLKITLRPHQLALYNLDIEIDKIKNRIGELRTTNSDPDPACSSSMMIHLDKVRQKIYNDLNSKDRWHKSLEEMDMNTFGFHDKKDIPSRSRGAIQASPATQSARETAAVLKQITSNNDRNVQETAINTYYQSQLKTYKPGSDFLTAVEAMVASIIYGIANSILGFGVGCASTLILGPAYSASYGYKGAKIARDYVKCEAGLQPTDSLSNFFLFKPRGYTSSAMKFAEEAKNYFNHNKVK